MVDLPFVPVMAMKGASEAIVRRSRQNSSISPMISMPAAFAFFHRPVRGGMGEGHARRKHQRGEARPVRRGEVDDGHARGRGLGALGLRIVPGRDLGPSGDQRPRGGEARSAEPEQGDRPPGECRGGRHRGLSLSAA